MRRRFRFRKSMLRGHPGDITLPVKRVIVRAHNAGLVVTSTTDGGHAKTSFHFTKPKGRAVDVGVFDHLVGTPEQRDRLVDFQRALIRRFGCSAFLELFGPDNRLNCKNQRPLTLDEGSALETAHDNHDHIVPASKLPLPKGFHKFMRALRRRRMVRRARKAGARHVLTIFRYADKHKISYPLALALFQHESNFRNQFGHDRDRNGRIIFHGSTGFVKVTPQRYRDYLAFRRRTGLVQGVGLGQLTSPGYQDAADKRGGAHRVAPNVDVSLEVLAGHIKALGRFRGIGAYNGGRGNPIASYAKAVLDKRDRWAKILDGGRK